MDSLVFLFLLMLFFSLFGLFLSRPISALFLFLAVIVTCGGILISMNLTYIGFLLVSVYGGAIVVLFLMVSMLFNKKSFSKTKTYFFSR